MIEMPEIDIESLRTEHESDEQWAVRSAFMREHQDKFEEDELVTLAQLFTNIEFLGCRYQSQIMKNMAEYSFETEHWTMKYRPVLSKAPWIQSFQCRAHLKCPYDKMIKNCKKMLNKKKSNEKTTVNPVVTSNNETTTSKNVNKIKEKTKKKVINAANIANTEEPSKNKLNINGYSKKTVQFDAEYYTSLNSKPNKDVKAEKYGQGASKSKKIHNIHPLLNIKAFSVQKLGNHNCIINEEEKIEITDYIEGLIQDLDVKYVKIYGLISKTEFMFNSKEDIEDKVVGIKFGGDNGNKYDINIYDKVKVLLLLPKTESNPFGELKNNFRLNVAAWKVKSDEIGKYYREFTVTMSRNDAIVINKKGNQVKYGEVMVDVVLFPKSNKNQFENRKAKDQTVKTNSAKTLKLTENERRDDSKKETNKNDIKIKNQEKTLKEQKIEENKSKRQSKADFLKEIGELTKPSTSKSGKILRI